MTKQHPITPPPIVREQWQLESPFKVVSLEREDYMIDRAAQWGADQELEACCTAIDEVPGGWADSRHLRHVRRPKPPSLKEQAQVELDRLVALISTEGALAMAEPIRRALEALDD
jgi:hypothetical protein